MELKQAIYTRRTVRDFADKPVDEGSIRQLIEAATQAPSAVNQQPWSFHVVRDREVLGRMSGGIADLLLRTSSAAASRHVHELMTDPGFDVLHHAPVLIVISSPADSPWATADCALAAENLMLMACDLGLGTCWIGSAQTWLATSEGRATLGLHEGLVPVAPIIVGYPRSTSAPPVPRKAPDVHWIGA